MEENLDEEDSKIDQSDTDERTEVKENSTTVENDRETNEVDSDLTDTEN